MRRSTAVQLILGAIVIAILTTFFGWPQLTGSLLTRYEYRDVPKVWRKPVPLPDLSISPTAHRKIAWMGYEIELPWDDIDAEKDLPQLNMYGVHFRSGNGVAFAGKDLLAETLNQLQSNAKGPAGKPLSGPDVYALHIEIVEITPDQVNAFLSLGELRRDMLLLGLKQLLPDSDSGIFEFRTPQFHGFQFESKHTRPTVIVDELYAPDASIEIHFSQRGPGLAPVLTQPEINRVLQSIHKVSVATAAPAAHPPQ